MLNVKSSANIAAEKLTFLGKISRWSINLTKHFTYGLLFIGTAMLTTAHGLHAQEHKELYKIRVKSIDLPPIVPYCVLGLNTYLVKKSNGDRYIVALFAKLQNYKWKTDVLQLSNETSITPISTPVENVPLSLYLFETIDLIVKVKKLPQVNALKHDQSNNLQTLQTSGNNVDLPYFIVATNKDSQKILPILQGSLNVNLEGETGKGANLPVTQKIGFKFNQKYFGCFQLLIGWKQTKTDYQNLEYFLKDCKATRDLYK